MSTKPENENDLLYKIAARVKTLSDENMPMLRRIADVNGPAALNVHKHSSRGELIEEILYHEFEQDTPREYCFTTTS